MSTNTDLTYRPAVVLEAMLRAKEISARELLAAHQERIDAANPRVNAIVTHTPELAAEQAQAADDAAARGTFLGPLHGLPVAFKDNHFTAGVATTFGSLTRKDLVPDEDDILVERMKNAGVVTLGKTNIPEFAAGGNTFNELFGVTRNPYDLTATAGGSSGGAAAALAAGMHAIADGNDMGGSLRLPAGYCNVIGLRPTPGRVPVHTGADSYASLGVSGPMGRTVADVALLLSVMAGPDGRAPLSLEEPGAPFATPHDGGMVGRRIAFSVDLGGDIEVEPEVADIVRAAAAFCEDAGAIVEEASPDFTGADYAFRTLRAWQFESTMGEFLDAHRDTIRPSLYANMEQGRSLTGPEVGRAAVLRSQIFHRMRVFLGTYDALLLPISPLPAFPNDIQYPETVAGKAQPDYLGWMRAVCAVTVTGHPAIAMPAGFSAAGTPVGVQFVGRHRAERELLGMAAGFEAVTGFAQRRPTAI